MADNAHMRVPEIALGMNMSWQSVPRMLHLIGPARTKQAVIVADERISAQEAREWGLVEEVAPPGKAFDAAMVLAEKIARQPPRARNFMGTLQGPHWNPNGIASARTKASTLPSVGRSAPP